MRNRFNIEFTFDSLDMIRTATMFPKVMFLL